MTQVKLTKRNVIIGKRSDMTIEDFHAHWSGPHARHAMTIPGAQRYIQCHISRVLWQTVPEMSDMTGFVELDYGTHENYSTAMSKMTNLEDLLADEARFLGAWNGCSSIGRKNAPIPSQRRIVGIIYCPKGVSQDSLRDNVEAYVDSIQKACSCYFEQALTKDARQKPKLPHFEWPDFFLYFDPGPQAELSALVDHNGPLLRGLQRLSPIGGAFLTRTEAKLMPGEQDLPLWPG